MKNQRKRTMISMQPEVYEAFSKMAELNGLSVSRWMGDWLESTLDSAQFVTYKVQQTRQSPAAAMRDFHTFAEARPGDVQDLYAEFAGGRSDTAPARKRSADGRGDRPAPAPASNTGLKSPPKSTAKPRPRPV